MGRWRAVLFDLDDTLYVEAQYMRSGCAEVAAELARRGFGQADTTAARLFDIHWSVTRQRPLNVLAGELRFPEAWILDLARLFREHTPRLELAQDFLRFHARLGQRLRLGCVSDGHLEVQRRKVDALGLASWVDAVVLTDEFGRDLWKPHPHAFRECCARLGVLPGDVVVVGDNPERDMRGARAATLPSIRIKRPDGYYSRFPAAPGDEADWEIGSLDELLPLLEA